MRKWHDAERCKTTEGHSKAAVAASTVGICKRPGGRGGGGERGGRRKGGGPAQETEVLV